MTNKSPETITFTPQEVYDHVTIPDEYRNPSVPKEDTPFDPMEHMYLPDAPTEPNAELENYRHKKDLQRKISKTALRSLETAFSIMSITQAGAEASSIANELLHEPATTTTIDADEAFVEALTQTREETVQKYVDALADLEADEQATTHATYHDRDIYSTNTPR